MQLGASHSIPCPLICAQVMLMGKSGDVDERCRLSMGYKFDYVKNGNINDLIGLLLS